MGVNHGCAVNQHVLRVQVAGCWENPSIRTPKKWQTTHWRYGTSVNSLSRIRIAPVAAMLLGRQVVDLAVNVRFDSVVGVPLSRADASTKTTL